MIKTVVSGALALLVACSSAMASVVVTGTRIVYPSGSRDVSIRLTNNGEMPALVQTWVDAGDPKAKPEDLDVPFSISPSIFRVDPTKTQIIRLAFLGATLPQDRESLYWLNVMEIPPKPASSAGENYLQFAIRSRLKIFYRPAGLKAAPDTASSTVTWSMASTDGTELAIRAKNPSPFYVSFAEIRPQFADGVEVGPVNGMVPPFGEETFKFTSKGSSAPKLPAKVLFKSVNDYGAFVDGAAEIR